MKVAIMATANEDGFKSRQTKYLCNIIDKPLIAYSIEQASKFSPDVTVVARPNDKLRSVVEGLGAIFVEHAAAKEFFAAFGDEPVLVLQGDDMSLCACTSYPFSAQSPTTSEIIARILKIHASTCAPATFAKTDDDHSHRFSFNGILTPDQIDPKPWHSLPYVVAARHFAPLDEIINTHPNAEPYHIMFYDHHSRILTDFDVSNAANIISAAACTRLSQAGANIAMHCMPLIGSAVTVEPDVVIYPNVEITGKTHIGAGSVIRSGTRIHNTVIGPDCEIEHSVIMDSTIGSATTIGPFAYVRPGSRIGSHCRIGDFVEIKNSTIGDNSKASHLGYIGDSTVGSNVNFGCGSITVNYDGVNKSSTIIEDGVFVGSNSNLIAPVRLGENSFVAAGSTITNDIPPSGLAIARQRQENKSGWKRPVKRKG